VRFEWKDNMDGETGASYACALTAACEEAEAKVANITINVASIMVAKAKHWRIETFQWQNRG
jgi:hypothetical protein